MLSKVLLLIWLVASCSLLSQAYGDDEDCGADVDLSLTNIRFVFTGEYLTIRWDLNTPTNCTLEYHVTITDSELGAVVDKYLEDQFIRFDAMSSCITYVFHLRAINKAAITPEGPVISMNFKFHSHAQIAPTLISLDVQTTSIKTAWLLEGKRNRCPLKNFYVNGGNAFNLTIPLEDLEGDTVPVEINSLQPDSMYYFQVAVENSGGLSPANQVAVQTLHE